MRRKLNIKNCFIALIYLTLFVVALWILASIIDTSCHNMPFYDGYQDFSDWNIFAMIDWAAMGEN